MTGWIIGGLCAYLAAGAVVAVVIGRAIRLADCCDHPEAG